MGDWRLIALDMDGTLLNREGMISEENAKWISLARQAGIEVTFATGRHIESARPYAQKLGLTVPLVTTNGSEVWAGDGTLLSRHSLEWEDIHFLHGLAVEFGTHFWSYTVGQIFTPHSFPKVIEDYTWLKFGFQSDDLSVIEQIWERLRARGGYAVTNSDPTNIEVNPADVSKAAGLKKVCDYLKITPEQVVAMGDSLNDTAMLQWAGLGIAMGNAQEEVKRVADMVTGHHLHHGVAQAIRELLESR